MISYILDEEWDRRRRAAVISWSVFMEKKIKIVIFCYRISLVYHLKGLMEFWNRWKIVTVGLGRYIKIYVIFGVYGKHVTFADSIITKNSLKHKQNWNACFQILVAKYNFWEQIHDILMETVYRTDFGQKKKMFLNLEDVFVGRLFIIFKSLSN